MEYMMYVEIDKDQKYSPDEISELVRIFPSSIHWFYCEEGIVSCRSYYFLKECSAISVRVSLKDLVELSSNFEIKIHHKTLHISIHESLKYRYELETRYGCEREVTHWQED